MFSTNLTPSGAKINNSLHPQFVTGLTDAEGTFTIVVDKYPKGKLGWRVQAKYQIGLNVRDLDLLLKIQQFFGGIGSVTQSGKMAFYYVNSVKDLTQTIIPHFLKYSLLTQKGADFLLFKQVVELMNNKAHLNREGLKQIINIKASINLGLSELLQTEFKGSIPVERPAIVTENMPDPNWITGFVNGEGTFDVKIYRAKNNVGFAVQLRFRIPQHERDLKLIELLMKYFDSGSIEHHPKFPAVTLVVTKFSHLIEKIIPFFELYPLVGVKNNDYLDWCRVATLMSNGLHLTQDGLNLIRQIKDGMNKGRK